MQAWLAAGQPATECRARFQFEYAYKSAVLVSPVGSGAHRVVPNPTRKSQREQQSWSRALADILVRCLRTGAPVPTGLKTEWVLLKSLPSVAVPLRCPACGQMHKWKPADAWIGSARPATEAGFLDAPRASFLAAASGGGANGVD
jgi:hypothetical protein